MSNDDDSNSTAQGGDVFFDDSGGYGIESAAGFVEEDHFGAEGEGTGDAETLLLTSGKFQGTLIEA